MSDHNNVTTGEIMEFLKDNMVTREELAQEFHKQKLDILDGVDDKLINLKADLVLAMRKEDRKVVSLISLLRAKQLISEDEAKSLLGMEPFPQVFPS